MCRYGRCKMRHSYVYADQRMRRTLRLGSRKLSGGEGGLWMFAIQESEEARNET
jgi:hypothetical protein